MVLSIVDIISSTVPNNDMITNTLPTTELEMKTRVAYGVIKY